jgi:acyl-CoA synthetase (AMP-forming)/AMP-acid ligase II
MTTLSELEVQGDCQRLRQCWETSATFAFLPEKLSVDRGWIEQGLSRLPDSMRQGHYVLLTSGTTGAPKLVVGQRARSEQLAAMLHRQQEGEPVEETVVVLPLSYSYAFVNQWLWSYCHQRRLSLTPGLKDPAGLQRVLLASRQAMICLVGVQVPLLASYFQGQSFPGIIRVHFAGGRFPQEQLPVIRALFPRATIFNNYGCAEALPRLTLRKAEAAAEANDIGCPLPGVELATNEATELQFRSPYGAVGLIEAGSFSPLPSAAWVKTGDLAQPTEHGSWRLLGRSSEVFKRHGEKISLAMLMTTINGTWAGQAVFYRERDAQGEEGHVLVLAPTPTAEQLQGILLSLRRSHGRAHWPLRIEAVAELPLLPNGKPDAQGAAILPGKTRLWNQRI